MDYKKSGGSTQPKGTPRYDEHNRKGSDKNPFGSRTTKAELLARMKAAADARKAQE